MIEKAKNKQVKKTKKSSILVPGRPTYIQCRRCKRMCAMKAKCDFCGASLLK